MKIKNLNKKGFTLIELLAVIVVLALIMVLAVPSVLTTMNSAKKKSFQMYGEKMLNSAMTLYETQKMMGTYGSNKVQSSVSEHAGKLCYTFKDLGIASTGSYKGFVVIEPSNVITDGLNATKYYVYLSDSSYAYNGTISTDVQNDTTTIKSDTTVATVDAIVATDASGVVAGCK